MDMKQEEIQEAVRAISLARAQISESTSTLEKYFPTIGAAGTLPAEQTINGLRRALRGIDRIVKTTPQRVGTIQQLPKVNKVPKAQ